jgi:hypothetical protein
VGVVEISRDSWLSIYIEGSPLSDVDTHSGINDIPRSIWEHNVQYYVRRNLSLFHTKRQLKTNHHILTPNVSEIYLNVIFISTLRSHMLSPITFLFTFITFLMSDTCLKLRTILFHSWGIQKVLSFDLSAYKMSLGLSPSTYPEYVFE